MPAMPSAYPLIRDTRALQQQGDCDVLVIGGGIYGAWTAYDAALRGLKVVLIEKNDWGSGTSSASSKLIHGGLRYLEHFEFQLVRHALAERRVLSAVAPHLVRPLRFMVPVWEGARAGMLKLQAGLFLYDFLAGSDQPVERHRRYGRRRLLERHPYLEDKGLKGGLSYGDCQEDDARMTLAVVAAAQQAGAIVANRVMAEHLLRHDEAVHGAALLDTDSGERFELRARCVVVAAGPWARALTGEAAPPVKLVKGVHLVMPAIPGNDDAFLFTAPQDGRVYFVIPWYGRTLLGTTESEVTDASQAKVTPQEVRYLLDAANAALPKLAWSEADVVGRFAGVRTLQAENEDSLSAVTREFVILQPSKNLVMPLGGKYTTARCDSVEIVDTVLQVLERGRIVSRTDQLPLPGAPPAAEFSAWLAQARRRLANTGIDSDVTQSLAMRHGTRIDRLLALIAENTEWKQRLHPQAAFIQAEVVLAVRDEMARSLDDVLRRRMPLSLLVDIDHATVETVSRVLATELGWDEGLRKQRVMDFMLAV